MANTYHQVYIQVVFAVKYRKAVLDKEWRQEVFAVMGNLINETGCKTIIVNGVEDHVHCFLGLKPSISISDLMKIVKAKSSKYINEKGFLLVDLNGKRALEYFHTANRTLIMCTNTLLIKRNTTVNKNLWKSILRF